MLVYVLHTTIVETLTGRTLGKHLLGLRVVGLDGKPASRYALMVRNVLRLIDAGLGFAPLVVVFFSPLRNGLAMSPRARLW